jgi:glutathione S-transferase
MLRLHGFPLSNYYNKVKLALLEKGLPFEEVLVANTGDAVDHAMSPLGKVPYLETEHGHLCESQVILDYIEARWPSPPLVPADPWQAAKQREINTFLDLHIELCARQLYAHAFFGQTLPEPFIARVKAQLASHLAAFKQLAVFGPYVAGDTFSQADCSAYTHLPLAGLASKITYGEDLVAAAGIDWKAYVKWIEQRPTAQKVAADRKADQGRKVAVPKAAGAEEV